MADKFVWETGQITRITNEVMICKDCQHKRVQAGICDVFTHRKPRKVIDGEQYCPGFKPIAPEGD